jgi:hypothetical protein
MKYLMEEALELTEASAPPNKETVQRFINQYSVSDDAYDIAVGIGKEVGWSQSQIEKAEKVVKKILGEQLNELGLSPMQHSMAVERISWLRGLVSQNAHPNDAAKFGRALDELEEWADLMS